MKQLTLKKTIGITVMLLALLFSPLGADAQVTIGLNEEAAEGALLQLKNIPEITDAAANATMGLALPRVALSDRKNLFPMFLNDPNNPNSGPNALYAAEKERLDKLHTGLLVYNIVEDDNKELYFGLKQWDGEKWNPLAAKMENAQFAKASCTDIVVNGAYIQGEPATPDDYLAVTLNVTRPGAFTIMAKSNNGYSFFLSGVALSLGEMTVNVPCQGTPVKVQTDKLIFSGMEFAPGCEPAIVVEPVRAEYSLQCANIVVNGQYLKGTSLTNQNTITLTITVAKGGSYHIITQPSHGIQFSAQGTFPAAGTHTVNLVGTGIPTINSDIPVTITTNTPFGNDVCNTVIPITLPSMTYAIIGRDVWSWAAAPRRTALDNGNSFGPNGVVKTLGLSLLWQEELVANAVTRLNNASAKKPDIILYFAYPTLPTTPLANALAAYVRNGGVVIYGATDNSSAQVNILMEGIFGAAWKTAIAQSGGSLEDNVYPINNLPNCPIVNGPFGNLANRHWGEDNLQTASVILTELPPHSVQIATGRSTTNKTRDPEHSIVWYNDFYNFIFFGDCGGASVTDNSSNMFPVTFTSAGLPRSKNYGPANNTEFVVNSALELNAVAWAIRKAAVSGINPH